MPPNRLKKVRRLGILGGGFDPVHRGHLNLARELLTQAKLDHLLFVPGHIPPHKPSGYHASFTDRLTMLRLATDDMTGVSISDLELSISGPGYSLTVIRKLKKTYSAEEYCLCLGADQYRDLPNWFSPQELAREVTFCIGRRPGETPTAPTFPFAVKAEFYATSLLDISASDIRRRMGNGMKESELAGLVPASVAAYIFEHDLYR